MQKGQTSMALGGNEVIKFMAYFCSYTIPHVEAAARETCKFLSRNLAGTNVFPAFSR